MAQAHGRPRPRPNEAIRALTDEPRTEAPQPALSAPGLARSAGILGLGNVASRVIGLLREAVISGYFGSSGELSAFKLAARVPTMIYDLLVGGMLSAALVPVFSEYSAPRAASASWPGSPARSSASSPS